MTRATMVTILVAATTLAQANGRFPVTSGVYFQPGDDHSIFIRSTFGLLISHDDGCSFRWVCEQNIGYNGIFDPDYAIARDGSMFATTYGGLRVSRDGGCSFTTATAQLPVGDPGRIADVYVASIDIASTGDIWVTTAAPGNVFRSTDNGITFAQRGLARSMGSWSSIAVAPSDPMTVYVAGSEFSSAGDASLPATPHFQTTTTGGSAWTAASLAGVQFGAGSNLAVEAVDPQNPQHLFLASTHTNGSEGDRLYRSTDGGAMFSEVLATTRPIASVVVVDATTVLVAAGTEGAFRSTDGGASFAPIAGSPQLGCLGKHGDALVGCGANWDPDFMAVLKSTDATMTWQKIFRFIEIGGALACPVGTPGHDVCDAEAWPALASQFGATGPTCPSATDFPPITVDQTSPATPGCCDASTGSPPIGALVIAAVTSWLLVLRRRM